MDNPKKGKEFILRYLDAVRGEVKTKEVLYQFIADAKFGLVNAFLRRNISKV